MEFGQSRQALPLLDNHPVAVPSGPGSPLRRLSLSISRQRSRNASLQIGLRKGGAVRRAPRWRSWRQQQRPAEGFRDPKYGSHTRIWRRKPDRRYSEDRQRFCSPGSSRDQPYAARYWSRPRPCTRSRSTVIRCCRRYRNERRVLQNHRMPPRTPSGRRAKPSSHPEAPSPDTGQASSQRNVIVLLPRISLHLPLQRP